MSHTDPAAGWPAIELREVRVFLTLAEELHYGRTAERLLITPARVSQTIQTLEAKLGGRLFERTSRRVKLTTLGEGLRERTAPAYAAMQRALDATKTEANASTGPIRIGFTSTAERAVLTRLLKEFQARNPGYTVSLHELDVFDPYSGLSRDEIDALYHHFPVTEPGLTAGPVLARYDLFLAVVRGHRLAGRGSVSIEDLGGEEVARVPSSFPSSLRDLYLPPQTPSGRPIRRTRTVHTINEAVWLVAQGRIVYPVITPHVSGWERDDIVLVPFTDLGPAVLGLIWRTGRESAGIRALAEAAGSLTPDGGARSEPPIEIAS